MQMKKIFLLSVAFGGLLLASCSSSLSSSLEKDVRKMASYKCQLQKLRATENPDAKIAEQTEKLEKEMEEFRTTMQEKYKDKKDDKEMNETADKIMDEEMAKCK